MTDERVHIPVEYDLRPSYYDRFQCLMGDCIYNCCQASWRISFNKKDYLFLKRLDCSPELGASLKSTLRRVKKGAPSKEYYGEFIAVGGGHCPLQREDGLCSLQREKGAGALPEVCRTFPRGGGVTDAAFRERSLSPACEGVLELLWNLPGGVDFVSDPLSNKERRVVLVEPDCLHLRFQDIRSQCIDLLQDRRRPLPQRILLMGVALRELSDGETDIDRWLLRTKLLSERFDVSGLLADQEKNLPMFLSNNIKVLNNVHTQDSYFAGVLDEMLNSLGLAPQEGTTLATFSVGPYLAARARFEERFRDRDYFMENLMVTLFFYLCLPIVSSAENLWKSYVNYCNLYSFYRFMAVMSCREGTSGDKAELFRLMVYASRSLLHNNFGQTEIQKELFQNDSATLAHMAILLSG